MELYQLPKLTVDQVRTHVQRECIDSVAGLGDLRGVLKLDRNRSNLWSMVGKCCRWRSIYDAHTHPSFPLLARFFLIIKILYVNMI